MLGAHVQWEGRVKSKGNSRRTGGRTHRRRESCFKVAVDFVWADASVSFLFLSWWFSSNIFYGQGIFLKAIDVDARHALYCIAGWQTSPCMVYVYCMYSFIAVVCMWYVCYRYVCGIRHYNTYLVLVCILSYIQVYKICAGLARRGGVQNFVAGCVTSGLVSHERSSKGYPRAPRVFERIHLYPASSITRTYPVLVHIQYVFSTCEHHHTPHSYNKYNAACYLWKNEEQF